MAAAGEVTNGITVVIGEAGYVRERCRVIDGLGELVTHTGLAMTRQEDGGEHLQHIAVITEPGENPVGHFDDLTKMPGIMALTFGDPALSRDPAHPPLVVAY